MAQQVKNLPAMRETWVQSLGWEDPLEKRKATPIPGLGRSPWRRERLPTSVSWPGEFHGYSSWGCKELDTTE